MIRSRSLVLQHDGQKRGDIYINGATQLAVFASICDVSELIHYFVSLVPLRIGAFLSRSPHTTIDFQLNPMHMTQVKREHN